MVDAIWTLEYLFLGSRTPPGLKAADTDDNGNVEFVDAIVALEFLFLGFETISSPYPNCGPDPSDDTLSCESFRPCEETAI
jgi:hypothetical protein